MLAQAESLRAAAREELEAQRIYAEAAMLKSDAHAALDQLKAQLGMPELSMPGVKADEVAAGHELTHELTWETTTARQEALEPAPENSVQVEDGTGAAKESGAKDSEVVEEVAGQDASWSSKLETLESLEKLPEHEDPGVSKKDERADGPQRARSKDQRIKAA